jgi:hypothetical protein
LYGSPEDLRKKTHGPVGLNSFHYFSKFERRTEMPHVLLAPDIYRSRSFPDSNGNTECVEFIKQSLNAPVTSVWYEGTKIKKIDSGKLDTISKGTAIATFFGGRYPQNGTTGKHAAIYLGQDAEGIQVLDQWNAQGRVLPRTIPWQPRRPGLSNDGNAFSVIEW